MSVPFLRCTFEPLLKTPQLPNVLLPFEKGVNLSLCLGLAMADQSSIFSVGTPLKKCDRVVHDILSATCTVKLRLECMKR